MSNFETIKATLKDKWLDYYEANQQWICKIIESRNTIDAGTRPQAPFILGVITVLEPTIIDCIYHFSLVTNDQLAILDALGLSFDPQQELENRAEERKLAQEATLIPENNVIALLSEDPAYRAVQEGLDEIRAYGKKQENSS